MRLKSCQIVGRQQDRCGTEVTCVRSKSTTDVILVILDLIDSIKDVGIQLGLDEYRCNIKNQIKFNWSSKANQIASKATITHNSVIPVGIKYLNDDKWHEWQLIRTSEGIEFDITQS